MWCKKTMDFKKCRVKTQWASSTPRKSFFIVLRCHGHRPGDGGTASSSTVPCAPSIQVTFQTSPLFLFPGASKNISQKPQNHLPKHQKYAIPINSSRTCSRVAQVAAGAGDHDGPAPLCQSGAQWNAPRSAAGTARRRPGAEATPLWALCDPAPLGGGAGLGWLGDLQRSFS